MHRWSKLFIPTLREAPADAEVASHRFLIRSGYIRQLGAGIYNYLFLGQRAINKIIAIVREEMDQIGQEFYLPALLPKEPWEQSGRWTTMGDNMFRLKDRKGAELCLGMTHEEIMTTIAKNELRSYKQLPQIWYQIQTKFRDEPRPKSGLLRVRQFTMKDAYSFDIDKAGLDKSFELHDAVYRKIFSRCGLKFVAVEADSGSMGGSQSQEFMVYTDAGEDLIASCPVCGYAANLEKATSRLGPVVEMEPTGDGTPEFVHTPGCAAISDVAEFFKISPASDIKCVAYMALKRGAAGKPGVSTSAAADSSVGCEAGGNAEMYDAVIVASPAWAAGTLLGPVDAELGEELGAIPYSSSITVNLIYDEAKLGRLPDGFGFLVPAVEGRAMLACTFVHRKFLGRTPPGKAVLRAFLGGMKNEALLTETDAALVATVRRELGEILGEDVVGIGVEPEHARVSRWRRAMAQYAVGHQERMERIAARVAALPGLRLAGNAYDGIGIPDCIRLGRRAAKELLASSS
jgi:hypothetical protein